MINLLITLLIFDTPILDIQFSGSKSISSKKLAQVILSKKGDEFNELNLSYDTQKILKVYKGKGFFNTEVRPNSSLEADGAHIIFSIKEGSRPRVAEIVVRGDDKEKLKKYFDIKLNDYFIEEKIINTKQNFKEYYRDRGYPYVIVSASVKPDSGVMGFNIDRGKLYYIRTIQLHGLEVCNPKIVLREIELTTGDNFCQSKLRNSRRRIYSLGFFSTVDVQLIKDSADSLDLLFSLRELKSRLLNFGIGLSIPLSFLGSFSIEELNLFNVGHRLDVRPSFKINLQKEWDASFEGSYIIPYLTPLELTASILPFYRLENKTDFFRTTRGGELRFSKMYSEHIQFNIGNKYKFVHIEPKKILPDTFKGVTNSIKIESMFDYRDEFFNPHKGVYLLPLFEYAGGILGGDNNFLRFGIEERSFLPTFNWTFAHRLRIGWQLPTDGIDIYEKYALGGQYSLRGYPEKSVGPDSIGEERYGELMANLNLEERITIFKNFGIVIFVDAGIVNNRLNFEEKEFIKYSTGIGLRYYTPIGPIRLDMGFPLTEKGREIYLGIYHIF